MKLGIALALVIAFPTMAAAQYVFQLRPSPYRVLSGWEQSANARGPSIERVTRAVTPVIDRTQAGRAGSRPNARGGDATGSTPRY